jgi:23S rRNA (guanine2445-N2)-methyltransferase / 23S rRNA (guanine2069-N7)-methyltransferase
LSDYQFYSSCARGLEDLLATEIEMLGQPACSANNIQPARSGVSFSADIEFAYRLCMWSRVASRVLLKIATFDVDNDDGLYQNVGQIDWLDHFSETNTLAVSCFTVHPVIKNSHFATLRVKDAIVDQFKQRAGQRPDIDREQPDIRISVFIGESDCTVYLDLSGDALHKRGYRQRSGKAPLRETLAAALLYRCKWPELAGNGQPFYDPMCGSGTLLIEAAMMASDTAPGLSRLNAHGPHRFGFEMWKQHNPDAWSKVCDEALQRQQSGKAQMPVVAGSDVDESALSFTRKHVSNAGFQSMIKVFRQDASQPPMPELTSVFSGKTGLILTNPPYGKRIGEQQQLRALYHRFGQQLRRYYSGWSVAVITSEAMLASSIGLRAFRKNTFYNGAIKSMLYQYRINAIVKDQDTEYEHADNRDTSDSKGRQIEKNEHAQAFRNRLKKNYRHLKKWANKNNIECYRVYDADIPQYAVAIDIYADWVHIQEYQAPKTVDKRRAFQRINDVIDVVSDVLETSQDKVVLKVRQRQKGRAQYEKLDQQDRTLVVNENDLKFIVNLHDYLDTGLFLDHRETRQLVRRLSKDKNMLNLFAYTGSVTVYAASGGARQTTTVDMSKNYLVWAEKNMQLNGFKGAQHRFVRDDCLKWIAGALDKSNRYDLIFIDPPTFSNSKKMDTTLDIVRDHVALLSGCLTLLSESGRLIFSTNARGFKLSEEIGELCHVRDITQQTTSEDFKRRPLHKCWCLTKDESLLRDL